MMKVLRIGYKLLLVCVLTACGSDDAVVQTKRHKTLTNRPQTVRLPTCCPPKCFPPCFSIRRNRL